MNKKVFTSMLGLCVAFLLGLYFVKLLFPQQFVLSIENESVIAISKVIDKHKILYYIFGGITAFITYWLYCCACSHKLYLNWKECFVLLAVVVLVRLINFVDTNVATAVSTSAFFFLPVFVKADLKTCAIVYTVHVVNQGLTLSIRNLLTYATYLGALNIILLSIDMYLWLLLFYIIFNYKKKEIE